MLHPSLRALLSLAGFAAAAWPQFTETPLTSGVPATFTIPVRTSPLLLCCFRIEVPAGATRLEVRVSGAAAAVQFALAVRFGQQPVASPLTTDYPVVVGVNPLVITPSSAPPLRGGTYFIGGVIVSSPAAQTVTMTATVTAPPPVSQLTSVSAASLTPGASPDSIVSSFGAGLAGGVEVAPTPDLPEFLGDVTVAVTDSGGVERPAKMFFAAPGQVNFLLGAATALGTATVRVRRAGRVVAEGPLRVERVAPAIFTAASSGQGVAAAQILRVGTDGSQTIEPIFRCAAAGNCSPLPLDPASSEAMYLLLYGTGMRGRSAASAVSATVGGMTAEISDAVPQGQYLGLDQANIRLLPAMAGRGVVNVVVTIDGRASNTVAIQLGGTAPAPPPAAERLPPVPSARVYQPVATGLEWGYRVTFPQTVRVPHKPIVEEPQGLLCSNVFCGLQTWNAGQIEFRMTANDLVSNEQGTELWNATITDRGGAFFFPTTGPIQIRRRLIGSAGDDVQLELVHRPTEAFRLVRPLSRPASGALFAGILRPETVTVPGGTFTGVATTEVSVTGDAGSGFTGTYRTEIKLAPYVGIVRAVMRDPNNQILFTMELTRFTEPSPPPQPKFYIGNLSFGVPAFANNQTALPIEVDFEDPSGSAASGQSLTISSNLDGVVAGGGTLSAEGLTAGQTSGRMRLTTGFPFLRLISGRRYVFTFILRNANRDESNAVSGAFTMP